MTTLFRSHGQGCADQVPMRRRNHACVQALADTQQPGCRPAMRRQGLMALRTFLVAPSGGSTHDGCWTNEWSRAAFAAVVPPAAGHMHTLLGHQQEQLSADDVMVRSSLSPPAASLYRTRFSLRVCQLQLIAAARPGCARFLEESRPKSRDHRQSKLNSPRLCTDPDQMLPVGAAGHAHSPTVWSCCSMQVRRKDTDAVLNSAYSVSLFPGYSSKVFHVACLHTSRFSIAIVFSRTYVRSRIQ